MERALPTPRVHAEFIKGVSGASRVYEVVRQNREAILRDPTGVELFGIDFTSSYTVTYAAIRAAALYEHFGREVVVVGPRMQANFAATDLSRVPPGDLHLPYPCFYLAVPEAGESLVLWGGPVTRWHSVDGVYVYRDPARPKKLCLVVWAGPNSRSTYNGDDALFNLTLDLDNIAALGFDRAAEGLREELDGSLNQIEHDMKTAARERATGLTLDDVIPYILNHPGNEESDAEVEGSWRDSGDEVRNRVTASMKRLLRIIVCTCLYMTSPRAHREEAPDRSEERARLQRELNAARKKKKPGTASLAERLARIPVYRTVWIGGDVERAVGADTDLTVTGDDRAPARGYYRCGHMHPYRTGPRKAEDGSRIDPSNRGLIYHWNPAVWVPGRRVREHDAPRTYAIREGADAGERLGPLERP